MFEQALTALHCMTMYCKYDMLSAFVNRS